MGTTTEEATAGLFTLAIRTPFNIALERAEALAADIFGSGKWTIRQCGGEANFYAVPGEAEIYLSSAGLASLWCLSYVAFHIIDVGSRARVNLKGSGQTTVNISAELAQRRTAEYLDYARALFRENRNWPSDLPYPDPNAAFATTEGRVNNLFFGALSWILLHEVAHVHHQDEMLIPSAQRIAQEYRADDFATRWILDDAGQGLNREFRIVAISVALAWLFLNEAELGPGAVHPAAILRFREAADHFRAGNRSVGLENAAYLFKALFDPATSPPTFSTALEMFEWTSQQLETRFQI